MSASQPCVTLYESILSHLPFNPLTLTPAAATAHVFVLDFLSIRLRSPPYFDQFTNAFCLMCFETSVKALPRYMSKRPLLSIKIPDPSQPLISHLEPVEVSCFSPDSPELLVIESTSDEESENGDEPVEWIASPQPASRRTSGCMVGSEPLTPQKTECWPTRSTTC